MRRPRAPGAWSVGTPRGYGETVGGLAAGVEQNGSKVHPPTHGSRYMATLLLFLCSALHGWSFAWVRCGLVCGVVYLLSFDIYIIHLHGVMYFFALSPWYNPTFCSQQLTAVLWSSARVQCVSKVLSQRAIQLMVASGTSQCTVIHATSRPTNSLEQ